MRFASLLLVLALAACSGGADEDLDADTIAVLTAALASQPDMPAQMEAWFEEEPDERRWTNDLFDFRLCVARELAGEASDYDRNVQAIGRLASGDSISGAGIPDIGADQERWDEAERRSQIPAEILPDHLRWDNPLAICPNGALQLSHPQIDGDRARVYIDNRCSGWCGWGGMLELRRIEGEWQAGEMQIRWVA